MTEEQNDDLAIQETVSESADEAQEQHEEKMVPLAAMLATRRKLQDAEARRQEAEAKAHLYEEYMLRAKAQAEEVQEDPNALVEKKDLRQNLNMTKREIMETLYQDMNPEAMVRIETYLKQILEKKPWLADSIDNATNRYSRANEIVNDYLHLVEEKPKGRNTGASDAQRIVQNANKPRSPTEMGKSAQPGGLEFLKNMQGKKEFREYRQKVLRGEV